MVMYIDNKEMNIGLRLILFLNASYTCPHVVEGIQISLISVNNESAVVAEQYTLWRVSLVSLGSLS